MNAVWMQLMAFFDVWWLWLATASAVMFIISLISIPFIVALIPVDYFTHHRRHRLAESLRHPAIEMVVVVFKNLLGATLLLAGLVMLFTPGQGLISILFGLMIMNYPGKYRLECWIIKRPLILHAVNSMRQKRGKPPLLPPDA